MDGYPFPEPFGPVYARPQGSACPDCECCTKALCEKAAESEHEFMRRCEAHAASGDYEIVRGCPCPTRDPALSRPTAEEQ